MERKTNILKVILISIIFALVFLLLGNNSYAEELKAIKFQDANLYDLAVGQIENQIGKEIERKDSSTHTIYMTQTDIDKVKTITINSTDNVSNLSGIESFTKITRMSVIGNRISNISPLASLVNLNILVVNTTSVSNISPLSNLTNLVILDLSNNKITDVSPLANIPSIPNLDLSNNQISDISALANTSISSLKIKNQTIEINTTTRGVDIPQIFKEANKQGSLVYTSEFPTRENCRLTANGERLAIQEGVNYASVTINGGNADGTKLIINANIGEEVLIPIKFNDRNMYNTVIAQIKDEIGKEVARKDDQTLTIYMAQIDIDCVSQIIVKSENNVSDLSGVEKFRYIYQMSIIGQGITDISPLATLTDMELLLIENTQVSDVSPLANLTKLWVLDIDNNNISNVSSLANLTKLWSLNLNGNKISDISALKNIKTSDIFVKNQTLTIESGSQEILLPQIFMAAKQEENPLYTSNAFTLENCTLSEDGTRVIMTDVTKTSKVSINGGNAAGTTLTITFKTLTPPIGLEEVQFNDANMFDAVVDQLGSKVLRKEDATLKIYMVPGTIATITSLDLYNKNISNIAGIEKFTSLTELDVGANQISDISMLAGLTNLSTLTLDSNKIADISALASLTSLSTLDLSNNNIGDISAISNISIRTLSLFEQRLSTITETKEVELPQIFIAAKQAGNKIYTDQAFALENCVLSEDGTKVILNDNVESATVTIKGGYASRTVFTITSNIPKIVLTGIEITKMPNKTTYFEGEKYNVEGMEVMAVYSNGDRKVVTNYNVVPNRSLTVEDNKLIIRYTEDGIEKSATIGITVVAKQLVSIEITRMPNKTEYYEGEAIDSEGMEVTAVYNNGDRQVVTNYEIEPNGVLSVEDNEITISYTEEGITKTATIEITVVAKQLVSIEITKMPNKTEYYEGEAIDSEGMEVTAVYNNGDRQVVTNYEIEPNGVLSVEDNEITISYTEEGITKTATIEITVVAKQLVSIEITKMPNKTTYFEGEKYNVEGMEVMAVYSNGDRKVVTNYNVVPNRSLTVEDNKLIIRYTEDGIEKSATIGITVVAKQLVSIEITRMPNKNEYYEGETIDPEGMVVVAIYNNGDRKEITDYEVLPNRPLTLDDNEFTVRYTEDGITKEMSAELFVNKKELVKVDITRMPNNNVYYEGDMVDVEGIKVIAIYNNGETKEITDYEVFPDRPLTVEDIEFTVRYTEDGITKEMSAELFVNKKELDSIEITKMPDKLEYYEGEAFNPDGMEVTAIYNNGERVLVTNYSILTETDVKENKRGIIISYTKDGITKTARIEITIIEKEELEVEIDGFEEVQDEGISYINKIKANETIEDIKDGIKTNGEIKVLDKAGNIVTDHSIKAATGTKVVITKGEDIKEFILIVKGDTNGNGTADFSDMLKMNKHRLGKVLLEGAFFKAGDIDENGIVNFSDMLKVNKFRLGKIEQL